MSTEYFLATDPQIHSRIRPRYSRGIEALTSLGFRQLCYYIEQLRPFSAVFQLPMLLLMLGHREVLIIQSPLRISLGFILMYHTAPPTIALPMGLGTKLYTDFADRSMLISYTFPSPAVSQPSLLIRRIATTKGLNEAWRLHQTQVRDLEEMGKMVHPQTSFNSYVDMSRREEGTFQYFRADKI
jgi:hypothetical protein